MTRSYDLLPKSKGPLTAPELPKLASAANGGPVVLQIFGDGTSIQRGADGKIIWPDKRPPSAGYGASRVLRILGQ